MKRVATHNISHTEGTKSAWHQLTVAAVVLAALVLVAPRATAQHYIGVRGGYGAAHGRFYPKFEKTFVWGKYTGGVAWKYYSDQQVVGGVGAELLYQRRGYTLFRGVKTDTRGKDTLQTRVVNSLTVPLMWQPHIYLARQRLRLFLNLGITVSYNLGVGDTFAVTTYKTDNEGRIVSQTGHTQQPYVPITARDNRWNYGLCGGVGFGVLAGRWEFVAEGRYWFGMSDILRNKNKYIFNEIGSIRSELDNLFFTVGIFFRLGKGGITERPLGKRGPASPVRENDFRNVRPGNMRY